MKAISSSLSCILTALTIVSFDSFVEASTQTQFEPSQANNSIDTFSATSEQLAAMRSDYQGRSKEYSLDEATNYAIANNSTIQAAYKGVQSKQWSAISDKRLWWPTVSGAGPMGDITRIPTLPLVGCTALKR